MEKMKEPIRRLFDTLTDQQADLMRSWARENYQLYEPIDGIWHPVVQLECVLMNMETGYAPVPYIAERIHALFERGPPPHNHVGVGYCPICNHYGEDCTGKRA